jgi:hypothetical protein
MSDNRQYRNNKRKPEKKPDHKRIIQKKDQCNICGYPDYVSYQEKNEDTGKIETLTHIVECLGHEDVHPSLWNKSKDYDKYQKFMAQQHRRNG